MTSHPSVPDAGARRLAETTFDRNVVVVAGAGTGKTTLLVNRLIHTLMREPRPVSITQIVALTFTNKAATEMKLRLRERLLALANPDHEPAGEPGIVRAADLRERYGLPARVIGFRAEAALRDLEKAQIGTLHSFAAHLLRLHPIESGVAPAFREDDGLAFEEHFTEQWELWLAGELGPNGTDHDRWRPLLRELGLERLREVAYALCSELISLDELAEQVKDGLRSPALRDWFEQKHARAGELLAAYDRPKRRKVELCLSAAQEVFRILLDQGSEGLHVLPDSVRAELSRELGTCPNGWSEEDFAECSGLIRIAKRVLAVDETRLAMLLSVLTPFVRRVRATFLEQGWISFDGLLARARALLREHPGIRERLKQEYRAILVDEFQDTDPSQYEILLYLSEQRGRCGDHWRDLVLEPGKLFIVGDPKQSIYAFRRADMEAFDRVVNKIQASGGVVYDLVTNFRSHAAVLDVVNAVFDRLLQRRENLQPPNVPLAVQPGRLGGVQSPGVELRLVRGEEEDEELDSAAVTRIEADALASWLKEDLLGRETLTDAQGRVTPLKPGHIAILFRKLTQAQDYLEALRRHGIPYLTDGEKHFYRRQEVVDLVNVLRVVENPHDTIALAGVLRSPLGGLTDRELYELRELDALDYRMAHRLAGWTGPRASIVRRLYERLTELYRTTAGCSLPEAVDLLFAKLPILELAAASLHGEQAVANLLKVRSMAAELADHAHLTLAGFVELMIDRLLEQPEEAESALAEESLEAVRVLTIHKAKGLEFPVVILAGLHHGTNTGRNTMVVCHDWSTGVLGLSLTDCDSLGAVLIAEKTRAREEAEARRVFYVGMTRARERLILSGGITRSTRGTLLSLFEEAVGAGIGLPDQVTVQIGGISIKQTVVTKPDRISYKRQSAPTERTAFRDWTAVIGRWEQRDRAWETARATRHHLTPSLLVREAHGRGQVVQPGVEGREQALVIGTLTHRVLEHWDFNSDPGRLRECVESLCRPAVPLELEEDAERILAEIEEILRIFIASKPYADLRRAEVVGREVPFIMPWPGSGEGYKARGTMEAVQDSRLEVEQRTADARLMEGTIDLVYRLDGHVWVADYKTDRVAEEDVERRASEYQVQAKVYTEAVARCLGVDRVRFQFLFLRNGTAVSIGEEA